MVNRRQFGIWTASALFLGPGIASAGEPSPQQAAAQSRPLKVPVKPGDLEALTFAVAADPWKPGERLVLQLSATNPEKSGVVVIVDTAGAVLSSEGEKAETMSWMNDDFPYSRRVMAPSFVDIGPETTTVAGTVNVEVPEELAKATDTTVTVTLRVSDGQGHSRLVELPPFPLHGEATKS